MNPLAARILDPDAPCFVIAEAGVNHNGDPALAHRLVEAAASTGADAVKFQTFRAALLVTRDARKAAYQVERTGADDGQEAMLAALELSFDTFRALKDHAESLGLAFLSTPFDVPALEFLAGLGVGALKLSSGEVTHRALLESAGATGLPVLLSTGMSTLADVEGALLDVASGRRRAALTGPPPLVLLHCVSSYPARAEDVHLRAMPRMGALFGVPVGYSDHTPGIELAPLAVALGARVFEKHLTLDRALPGPDHAASLEPAAFAEMIARMRLARVFLGSAAKAPAPVELEVMQVARRSVVAAEDIPRGTVLAPRHLIAKRPATGLAPRLTERLLGLVARRDIRADELVSFEMLESNTRILDRKDDR